MKSIFKFSKGDLFGGITAGIVALPLALAFGVQSGAGAEAGLYGAILLGFFAAIFGGTETQISGPTGPMTVVSAATIGSFIAMNGSLQASMGAIVLCFALAGIIQILLGVFKTGTLIKYIPYPVVSGFMSGIGVIIILQQLFPAFGVAAPRTTLDVIRQFPQAIQQANIWAVIYAVLTIAIIYLFPRITKAVPSTLVALILVTVLNVFLKKDVAVIGEIPSGFPMLRLDSLFAVNPSKLVIIVEAALTLALLGAIDSLLTSVVADNVTRTKHNSNKELIGQGIGNTVAGLFGGLPGAGATMRTLVNIRSGGKHRMSGIIHALVLLVILLGAGPYAAIIPNAVLAGILITVGIGILDYKGLRHIKHVPRSDAVIMLIVLFVTSFFDLLLAVGIGMMLASLIFMKKMGDSLEMRSTMESLEDHKPHLMADENVPDSLIRRIYIKRLTGPLFFGSVSGFKNMVDNLPEIQYVIIRMHNVPFVDQSGLYALEEAILDLERRGIEVIITGLQEQPRIRMESIRIIPALIEESYIFEEFDDAISYLAEKEKIATNESGIT